MFRAVEYMFIRTDRILGEAFIHNWRYPRAHVGIKIFFTKQVGSRPFSQVSRQICLYGLLLGAVVCS